jgi:hypothetical protein
MKAAQVALQQNSRQQAVTLLDQYWPQPGEPDLRGIEWRYLWQAARGDEIYTWKHPGHGAGRAILAGWQAGGHRVFRWRLAHLECRLRQTRGAIRSRGFG